MNKRIMLPVLAIALMMLIPSVSAGARAQAVTEPYIYATATIGGPRTLDPAWAYDTASGVVIMNVYETLVEFKKGSTTEFIGEVADTWTISPDGLTYTFHIRTGMTWSDGSAVTPADVEYSFERNMVRDRSGGPMWMLFVPLLGRMSSRPLTAARAQAIDNAITRDDVARTVTLHLVQPEGFFLQVLAQTWSSIVSKVWCTRNYNFPGGANSYFDFPGFEVTGYDTANWGTYNNYAREATLPYYGYKVSPMDNPPQMLGSGPFTFTEWVKGEGGHRTLSRYAGYWGGWPASAVGTGRAGQYPIPSRGYVNTVIEYQISSWTTRKLGLLAGTYDSVYVPRANIGEVWQQAGIRCRYPMESLAVDALFFNFNIADGMAGQSPYVGTGTWGPIGGPPAGIPLNFFNNLNVRKAFAYSFDYDKMVAEQFLGEAAQMASPIIPGLAPYEKAVLQAWHAANKPKIDLNKATYYFKLAWGGVDARSGVPDEAVLPEDPAQVTPGDVWKRGFKFSIVYNIGNSPREISDGMLRDQVALINPLFVMEVVGIEWATMLDEIWWEPTGFRSIIPIYTIGWQADYADADNFATPFQHTDGDFVYPQSYSNPTVDTLILEARAAIDPAVRIAKYNQLNQLFLQDLPDMMGTQGLGRRWERDWVQGWYFNIIFPGTNWYTLWKEEMPWEDVDANGKVEIKDITVGSLAYGSYFIQGTLPPYPAGPPGYYTKNWDSRVDVTQDMKVGIIDLAKIVLKFGTVLPPWVPPP